VGKEEEERREGAKKRKEKEKGCLDSVLGTASTLTNSSINHAWFPLVTEGDERLCPLLVLCLPEFAGSTAIFVSFP